MHRYLSALVAACTAVASACGGSSDSNLTPTSQSNARELAVAHTCDKYAACGEIAPSGKTYTSRDNCDIKQRSSWESIWPPAECDAKIDTNQLNICLSAIDAVECGNILDVV